MAAMKSARRNPSVSEEIRTQIAHLRHLSVASGLSDDDFDDCVVRSLSDETTIVTNVIANAAGVFTRVVKAVFKVVLVVLFICLFLHFVISCHNPTKRFLSRYIQGLIYPFMRFLRLTTLPIHRFYDATQWYQESCLVTNPIYKEPQVDCWPCEQVRFVVNLSGLTNFSSTYYHYGIPFVVKDASLSVMSKEDLGRLYLANTKSLDAGTRKFYSNNEGVSTPRDLLVDNESPDPLSHSEWSMNKVSSTRVLRNVFPRPYFVPKDTEVSLLKFLFLDGPEAEAYSLPLTDFANVWLSQVYGHRLVILEPSPQCQHLCNPVSLVLQAKDVLFFNWQFWRAISSPVNVTKGLTITYMASFY